MISKRAAPFRSRPWKSGRRGIVPNAAVERRLHKIETSLLTVVEAAAGAAKPLGLRQQ